MNLNLPAMLTLSPNLTHHPICHPILHHLSQSTSISQFKQIHAQTFKTSQSTHDPKTLFLLSRILHFSTSLDLDYAFRLFSHIENRNSFIWNTIIRACARSTDRKGLALVTYNRMLNEGDVLPDKHTFPFLLKACAYLFAFSEGKQAHAQILKLGLGLDVYVNNSLIHFYGSCGCLDSVRDVFNKMQKRSLVSWNVTIDAFVIMGEFENALKMFNKMQGEFEPDRYTLHSVVNACAGLGALALGIWVHAYILKNFGDDMESDVLINSSLIEMYCKSGSLDLAKQVFRGMVKLDVNSWNSMILGLAMHGEAESAFNCFTSMISEGFAPNSVTFVGVLSACNHGGLTNEGKRYFDIMTKDYKIEPVLEHYGCLIHLLACAGLLSEALDLVSDMHIKPDIVIWRSLLDACCKQDASVELSEEMARQIIESDEGDCSGIYVLLSRVYAYANKWNDVGSIQKLMSEKGIKKKPGCSSIEVDGVNHEFFAGDTTHPRSKEIYNYLNMIEQRLKLTDYELHIL